ncbi:hypothetical protein LJ655_07030 [Paraburkholderia sp. MMS20-SJTN17]|uniref:Uncharacterized protein n=1 Tax=Paraburkholderia translucens TaxID=2886945 RepID=A0ABS8KA95_9BURK|nr:hypothetical protein [Paraburkholderia sp. MMS20-SJTN17]MCC8401649.1 hypothetical protein [Paraburkholderia sp. MMS20-SJTN17]
MPGLSSYHVALFDKATGERISDAAITATVTSPAPKSRSRTEVKPLQEVKFNDIMTYGNYFDMPWRGRYRFDLSITRKNSAKRPTSA